MLTFLHHRACRQLPHMARHEKIAQEPCTDAVMARFQVLTALSRSPGSYFTCTFDFDPCGNRPICCAKVGPVTGAGQRMRGALAISRLTTRLNSTSRELTLKAHRD